MAKHYELGIQGEELAADFLLKKNYAILERNWRYKKAEIDIIAFKNDVLCIIEVKTRSTEHFGNPQNFVSRKKIRLLLTAVNEYIQRKNLDLEVRFDIIAIVKKGQQFKMEHIKSAFYYFDS